MDATHKPHPRDVDIAWNEAADAKLERAWESYYTASDNLRRAESERDMAIEDVLSTPSIRERYKATAHEAFDAWSRAAQVLRELGEDPEVYDQGREPWEPTPHHLI